MTIELSKSLFKALEESVEPIIPLEQQITRLFVPNLWWNDRLVLRSSLRGKFITFVNKLSRTNNDEIILKLCAKAFDDVEKNSTAFKENVLRVHLFNLFHQKGLVHQNPLKLPTAPEIALLEKSKATSEKELNNKKFHNSIFRKKCPEEGMMTLKAFNQLLKTAEDFDLEDLNQFALYLQSKPGYAHPQAQQTLSLIQEAWAFNQEINQKAKETNRKAALDKLADQMQKEIAALGTNQKKLFCGSYGRKITSLIAITSFLQKLPKATLEGFPPFLKNLLSDPNQFLSDPSSFVKTHLHDAMDYLRNHFPDMSTEINSSFVQSLLMDESRTSELPLPSCLKSHLESWFQEGYIAAIMEFVPDGSLREICLWVAENTPLMLNPKTRDQFLEGLESKLMTLVSDPLSGGINDLERNLSSIYQQSKRLVPISLQELLGNDLIGNPFWITFEKQANGLYTLLVYTSGNGLLNHPYNDTTKQYQWPLRITNIEGRKLNQPFFHRLLMHHIEPQYNSHFSSSPEDLYEGLLQTLGGDVAGSSWKEINDRLQDQDLAKELLLHPSRSLASVRYERLHLAFMQFVEPYLKGEERQLHVDSEEVGDALKRGIEQLIALARQNGKNIEDLESTYREIQEAVLAPAQELPPLSFPHTFLNMINSIVSVNSLEYSREAIIWGLGDEITEVYDALISNLKALPPVKTPPTPDVPPDVQVMSSRPKGWLRTILFSGYLQVMLKVIKTLLMFYQSIQGGCLYLAKPLVGMAIEKGYQMLPQGVQDSVHAVGTWYANVTSNIKNQMIWFGLSLAYRVLLKPEQKNEIESAFKLYLGVGRPFAHFFVGKEKLDLSYHTPPKPLLSAPTKLKDTIILLKEDSVDSSENPKTVLTVPLEENLDNLNAASVVGMMINWKAKSMDFHLLSDLAEVDHSDEAVKIQRAKMVKYAAQYLLHRINQLPIGPDSFWKDIPRWEIPSCMEKLSDLALELNEVISKTDYQETYQ